MIFTWRDREKLDEVLLIVRGLQARLETIIKMEEQEMSDLSGITAAVEAEVDVTNSAIMLLQQLADLVRSNATDPVALADLADQLDTQREALASAVVANTPAAPSA